MSFTKSLKIIFTLLVIIAVTLAIILANNYNTVSNFKTIKFKDYDLQYGFNRQNGGLYSPSITGKVTSVSKDEKFTTISLQFPVKGNILDRIQTVSIKLSGDYAGVAEILEENPSEIVHTIKSVEELNQLFDANPYLSFIYPTISHENSSLEYLVSSPDLPVNLYIYKYISDN